MRAKTATQLPFNNTAVVPVLFLELLAWKHRPKNPERNPPGTKANTRFPLGTHKLTCGRPPGNTNCACMESISCLFMLGAFFIHCYKVWRRCAQGRAIKSINELCRYGCNVFILSHSQNAQGFECCSISLSMNCVDKQQDASQSAKPPMKHE